LGLRFGSGTRRRAAPRLALCRPARDRASAPIRAANARSEEGGRPPSRDKARASRGSWRGSAAQPADVAGIGVGTAAESRGARDQHIGACSYRGARRIFLDAAIDLEIDVAAKLVDAGTQRLELVERLGNEALSAEARIDAHHQHKIDVVQYIFDML